MLRWEMRWILSLLVVLVGCAGPPRLDGGIREPMHVTKGRLLVSAKLSGQPIVFLVDTGASVTSLSTAAARRLGIHPLGPTDINGTLPAQHGIIKQLEIGAEQYDDVPVVIVDLPNARDSRVQFDGILGLDILTRHDLVLDLARRTISLHPIGTLARESIITSQMERVGISHGHKGLILMQVQFDDHPPMPAFLDLGAPISVINVQAALMLGMHGPGHTRIHSMMIGNVDVRPRHMLVQNLPAFDILGLSKRPAMLIGSDVFEDRVLAIAFRDRVAFLSK